MAQKPEIQYIGQFYVHGSEAKKLARKTEQKKAKTELPLHRFERIRKVHVDVLAISSILVAAVLMVTMVMGTLSLQSAWQELHIAQEYVYELESANATLAAQYRSGYDLDEVRSAAIALGMIPVEEAQVVSLRVTVPEVQPEPTLLDDIVWFLEGLFA
jgi:hypothetical protein